MATTPKSPRRQALANFLLNARARLTPELAQLPSYGRRRTPGLRREEVAQLCGISVTWYTWIEQGREVKVSASVWSRLANAMQLNATERAYLFELADTADPELHRFHSGNLPESLSLAVNRAPDPCYVLDRYWNIIYFNKELNALFDGWPASQDKPNLLEFIFLEPKARDIVVDWEERAKRSVAEFRADTVSDIGEPRFMEQINALISKSPEFEQWWNRQLVKSREGGLRKFNHPTKSLLEFEQLTFKLASHTDYKLVLLISPSQPAAQG